MNQSLIKGFDPLQMLSSALYHISYLIANLCEMSECPPHWEVKDLPKRRNQHIFLVLHYESPVTCEINHV